MKTAFFFLISSFASGLFNHHTEQKAPKCIVAVISDEPIVTDSIAKRMSDTGFLIFAYNNGMYEVKAAKLARRMTGSRQVRKFAVAGLNSQEAVNKDIVALFTIKGIALPQQVPADLKARFDDLNSWMGKEFNDKYLGGTIEFEKKSTALFRFISVNAKDDDIRKFAKNTVGQYQARGDSATSLLKYVDRTIISTW